MEPSHPNRRRVVRTAGLVLATGGVSTLAGCGDPGDGDEEDDDGGLYRGDEFDPGSVNEAGTAAGGSSAG